MDQIEFEKKRVAQIRVCEVMSDNRMMKVIDLIELLLEREPDELVVLSGCFVTTLWLQNVQEGSSHRQDWPRSW